MSSKTQNSKAVYSLTEKISIVGVDLAKDKFDTYYESKLRTFGNNRLGLSRFQRFLSTIKGKVVVVYESTGAISRPFTRALMEMGVEWRCVPPYFVRSYATAMGIFSKTDEQDAQVIAEYAKAKQPKKTKKLTQTQLELQELEGLKHFYIRQRAHFKTARKSYDHPLAADCFATTLAQLDETIAKITKSIDEIINRDEELKARRTLYLKEPGVGVKTAQTLICSLPELGTCSGKEIAALVGVAPYDHSSGNMNAPKHIRGGRKRVRCAMYMAGIGVRRCKEGEVKDFYLRLKAAGKSSTLNAIACARKILLRLNAATRCMLQELQTTP